MWRWPRCSSRAARLFGYLAARHSALCVVVTYARSFTPRNHHSTVRLASRRLLWTGPLRWSIVRASVLCRACVAITIAGRLEVARPPCCIPTTDAHTNHIAYYPFHNINPQMALPAAWLPLGQAPSLIATNYLLRIITLRSASRRA